MSHPPDSVRAFGGVSGFSWGMRPCVFVQRWQAWFNRNWAFMDPEKMRGCVKRGESMKEHLCFSWFGSFYSSFGPLCRSSWQSCTLRVFSAPSPTKTTWRPSPTATWCTPFKLLPSTAMEAPPLHTQVRTALWDTAGNIVSVRHSWADFIWTFLSVLVTFTTEYPFHAIFMHTHIYKPSKMTFESGRDQIKGPYSPNN